MTDTGNTMSLMMTSKDNMILAPLTRKIKMKLNHLRGIHNTQTIVGTSIGNTS